MPKKLNKAGNEQEYVPAGNGDESGEYADDSGSNKHFTSFKKPQDDNTTKVENEEVTTENNGNIDGNDTNSTSNGQSLGEIDTKDEQPKKDLSQLLVNKLDKNSRKELIEFITRHKNFSSLDKNKAIDNLRFYSQNLGMFGDLDKISDEELGKMIDEIAELEFPKSDDYYYFKKGSKWYVTKDKEYLEFLGEKVYSKEEREQLEAAKSEKYLKNQNEADLSIQKIFGGPTVVCFGKGYSQEQLGEIQKATENLVNDFDGLKGYVSSMGDRTNLENYLNAVRNANQPTEQQIESEVARIKRYMTFYGDNTEEKYRQQAIRNLKGEVKISRLNRAYAYWNSTDKQMIFMPKMKNAKESLERDFEANFHPTSDEISVYYHEMGHATESMVASKAREVEQKLRNLSHEQYSKFSEARHEFSEKFRELKNQNFNPNYQTEYDKIFVDKFGIKPNDMNAYDFFNQKGKSLYKAKEEVEQELKERGINQYNVSRYGATNSAEFLAECFAGHYCNANNKLCTETVNLIKNYYNKLKEIENGI